MEKVNIKETIKKKAVEIFSAKGFHGASIREIANAAECSLPMLYYYYNNKNDLFEEVAYHEFIRLVEKLNSNLTAAVSPAEVYFQVIKQRKDLSPYDRGVMKLSIKVWLGFDGSKEVREKLMNWENERHERTKRGLAKACSDPELMPAFSNIMIRIMENMIEKMVLLDEEISDEEIMKEIDFMMNAVKDK